MTPEIHPDAVARVQAALDEASRMRAAFPFDPALLVPSLLAEDEKARGREPEPQQIKWRKAGHDAIAYVGGDRIGDVEPSVAYPGRWRWDVTGDSAGYAPDEPSARAAVEAAWRARGGK